MPRPSGRGSTAAPDAAGAARPRRAAPAALRILGTPAWRVRAGRRSPAGFPTPTCRCSHTGWCCAAATPRRCARPCRRPVPGRGREPGRRRRDVRVARRSRPRCSPRPRGAPCATEPTSTTCAACGSRSTAACSARSSGLAESPRVGEVLRELLRRKRNGELDDRGRRARGRARARREGRRRDRARVGRRRRAPAALDGGSARGRRRIHVARPAACRAGRSARSTWARSPPTTPRTSPRTGAARSRRPAATAPPRRWRGRCTARMCARSTSGRPRGGSWSPASRPFPKSDGLATSLPGAAARAPHGRLPPDRDRARGRRAGWPCCTRAGAGSWPGSSSAGVEAVGGGRGRRGRPGRGAVLLRGGR